MKAKIIIITAALILSGFFVTANECYAWQQPPVADLEVVPEYVIVPDESATVEVTLDASGSYDPGGYGGLDGSGIYMFEFDRDGDDDYERSEDEGSADDGIFDGKTTFEYSWDDRGIKTVGVRVTESSSKTATATRQLYINIKIEVPDIDNGISTIQEAINMSYNGATIEVAEGTYYENINFKGKKIVLTSTDPNNPNVVAGTIINDDPCDTNVNVVTFDSSEDVNSILRGFTITGGDRGIYCSSASPTISKCVITDNHSSSDGGGMYCTNSPSPTVTNCVFSKNVADDKGGGMYNNNSSPNVINCIFIGNSANSEANYHGGGAMYNHNSSPSVINCIFSKNYTEGDGGGIYNYGASSNPNVTNCTCSKNRAGFSGGGMYNYQSSPNVTNCIFWGNYADDTGDEIYNYTASYPTFSYCDINDWDPGLGDGGGNIDSDPNFTDASNPAGPDGVFRTIDDGLRLQTDSPCIDTGDGNQSTSVNTEEFDLGGNKRFMDGDYDNPEHIIDMGAYETPCVWFVKGDTSSDDDGKTWDTAFDELKSALDVVTNPELEADDEIWVATGIYKPGTERADSFELVENVGIYGGFAGTEVSRHQRNWGTHETILSGDIGGDNLPANNSYHVVTGADNATLDGFTITAGNANGSSPDNRGGGIYCSSASPTISNCRITGNRSTYGGSGIRCSYASPKITNCMITGNYSTYYAGGMSTNVSSPTITNCIFSGNTGTRAMFNSESSPTLTSCVFASNEKGAIANRASFPTLINCTFSGNGDADTYGGAIYNTGDSEPIVLNCVFWGDKGYYSAGQYDYREIHNTSSGSNPTFSYCDIRGCGGSGAGWDPNFGIDSGGNIDINPNFVNAENPAGSDGEFCTDDDGLRLNSDSPCIDAADGSAALDTDMCGGRRLDIDFVLNTGTGNPDYADIGAYEYDNVSGYITSFEEYQGYDGSIDGIDGWEVEGYAVIDEAKYWKDDGEGYHVDYPYQYVEVQDDSIISYNTDGSCKKSYIRINCIPSPGSFINIMNGSSLVASIKFGEDEYIYVLDNGEYKIQVSTDPPTYQDVADKCRDFLTPWDNYTDSDYSYENTWIEFTIQLNWASHTYDVSWTHYAAENETIYEEAGFHHSHRCYTKVNFETSTEYFLLNRMSISDAAIIEEGGVVGPDKAIWITAPEADILNPLKGQCIVAGPVWYDKLGEYVVKCCPVDLNSDEPNNWMQVCSGHSVSRYPMRLGYWNTEGYYNGSYFLKIEVYDDLRRLHNEGTITAERTFNGESRECKVRYPIIGRFKPRSFHYEEFPDFTINWPGTFPFEFKRTYNNGLRSHLYPLFFGWTHNHNIRLVEDCSFDWITDEDGNPVGDASGLGVGRLWLCQPSGGGLFIGYVDAEDSNNVIYEPLDNENHYIIRTSELVSGGSTPEFVVTYVYYAPDGMKMTFNKVFTGPWAVPADEGLVGWMVVAGIDSQEDRFGNALEYEWEEDEIHLLKISNNRTPANLRFTYELFGQNGPRLCSSVKLYEDDVPTNARLVFGVHFWTPDWLEYGVQRYIDGCGDYDWVAYTYEDDEEAEQEFILTVIDRAFPIWHNWIITSVTHNDDGTLIEIRDVLYKREGSSDYKAIKQYNYEYDDKNNLITTIKVKSGDDYGDDSLLLRKEVSVTSPEGAPLSNNISTFPVLLYGEPFDPYDYDDWSNWHNGDIKIIRHHAGGGGARDTEYYYEDSNFPLKPTKIIEYFDDDGDGGYDTPSRKTTMKYDERGNTVAQKVYVDDVNYVYTKFDYHEDYDFPVRKTTWQEYCHDDTGGSVVKCGSSVEKQWLYGDVNGMPIIDGNQGNYLIQESILLNEAEDEWADISYTYYPEGQIKQKTDPEENITYYEYDYCGFNSKEWQGVILDESGLPIGNSQKRYYYDGLGRKILQADYLGKVQMNVCDSLGRVKQARQYIHNKKYINENVMDPSIDFKPVRYDVDISHDETDPSQPGFDWWENRTLYDDTYYLYDRPWTVTLPTGGIIKSGYLRGRNDVYLFCYDIDSAEVHYDLTADGRILYEYRNYYDSCSRIPVDYIYDSMWRLLHKYSHVYISYDEDKYIKHDEYQYDASGNKIYEAVYSVERGPDGFVANSGVLEKANCYEYDILGRLTKKVVDSTDGGLNQTTEYGYDAAGNRIYVIDPDENVIFTDYDNANRKIREYFVVPAAQVVYDGDGDLDVEATKVNAIIKKEVNYYKNNKIKNVNSYDYDDSLLACTEYTYDSRGRIKEVQQLIEDIDQNNQMDLTDDIATTLYDYSDDGSLEVQGEYEYHIVTQDAADKRTGIKLSYHGKPEIIVYPSGDYEEYVYYSKPLSESEFSYPYHNPNGLLEKKAVWKDGSQDHITYEYDDFGKVKKITYPDEGYLEYDYTSRILGEYGKVKQITDHRDEDDRPGDEGSTFTFEYWCLSGKVKSYEDYEGYATYYDYSSAYDQPTEVNVCDPYDDLIYQVKYSYDLAGRLIDVREPLLGSNNLIAGFGYDDNGNRSELKYYRDGSISGPNTSIAYTYNNDNLLTKFETTGGPTFTFGGTYGPGDWANIDGLGRLKNADETITNTGGTVDFSYSYDYDMHSQLKQAIIDKNGNSFWSAIYNYRKDGNLDTKETSDTLLTTFDYDFQTIDDGDIMTGATGGDNFTLGWDWNGNMTLTYMASGDDTTLEYNWDNRLRSADKGSDSLSLKYDPSGNRVYKNSSETGQRKYIVDVSGELPTILLEIDPGDSSLKKKYIYADGEILAQHDVPDNDKKYFYLHDRLGSVRQVIDTGGNVVKYYTYRPFGETLESEETDPGMENYFMFTGQWFDSEIAQYYLRARQYAPQFMRFTSRDPVEGIYEYPITLHRYLYCINDPINLTDPSGASVYDLLEDVLVGSAAHSAATDTVALGVWYECDYLMVLGIAMHNEIGTIMEMHHVYPKFLGGDPKGIRVPMPMELHKGKGSSLHNKIYEQLLARFGELGARRGWKAQEWKYLLNQGTNRQEALQILMNVYMNFDSRYSLWLTISLIKQIKAQGQALW